MRITSVTAQNFLSFDRFSLSELDPTLNVIVGPNGCGKSNLGRALQMTRTVLAQTRDRQLWQGAQTLGSQEPGFTLRVDLEFPEEWEKQLLISFVLAAMASSIEEMRSRGKVLPDEAVKRLTHWAETQLTSEKLDSLFKGRLEVRYPGEPANWWEITYEFDHAGQRYRWVIERPDFQSGLIVPSRAERPLSVQQLSVEALLASNDNDFERLFSTPFDLSQILPEEERGVSFDIRYNRSRPIPESLRQFVERAGLDFSREWYPLPIVFGCLFRRNVFLTQDIRIPPRETFSAGEFGLSPDSIEFGDGGNLPLYLFRLKNGSRDDRATYENIRETFRALTDRTVDLHAEPVREGQEQTEVHTFRLQPVVVHEAGDIPIQFSGAGVWEALVMSAFFAAPEGRFLVLDEPALNLHATFQRRFLQRVKAGRWQTILITHSPYLIPTDREEDLYRIACFSLEGGATRVTRLQRGASSEPGKAEMARWIKEMARASDVPALLFAAGVILVEGETESGALPIWFAKSQTGQKCGTLEDRNLVMHWVGGDRNFRTYVRFLKAFAIPWAIICDGKILGKGRIFNEIGVGASEISPKASFKNLKECGKKHGVFTWADESSQEFENLPFVNPHLEQARQEVGTSKVRQGRYIAHDVECPEDVNSLYTEILRYLTQIQEVSAKK